MKKVFLLAILGLHLFILSRLTFTAWPEMLSYPYLFSNGFALYRDFIMPYPPGLVLVLSGIFKLLGFNPQALVIFTWVLVLLTDLLVFLNLEQAIKKAEVSIYFTGLFIILQSFLDGNMLWFDFATVLPVLGGFLFAQKWLLKNYKRDLFLTVFCISIAVVIKQVAIIYLAFFILYYLTQRRKIIPGEVVVILSGIIIILLPLLLFLLLTGSFVEFWNWTIIYPLFEWSKFPGYVNFAISKKYFLVMVLLFLPISGILLNFIKPLLNKLFWMSLAFLISALIAVYPRFSFFHLQPVLAFLIIVSAIIFNGLDKKFRVFYITLMFFVVISLSVFLFPSQIGGGIRFYGSYERGLARQISDLIKPGEKVFFLGLDSSGYIFTKTLPPKNWSDNFGWYLEIPGVQDWVLEGLKQNPPKFVFRRIPSEGNWYGLGTYQPKKIMDYIFLNYKKEGKIGEGVEIWIRKN